MQIMARLQQLSMKNKIIFATFAVACFCIVVTVIVSYTSSRGALDQMARDQLSTMRSISKTRVESFLNRSDTFTKLLASERLTEGLMLSYESAFFAAGYTIGKDQKLMADSYKTLDQNYGAKTMDLLHSYGLANFLLVNINGQVVYSARPYDYGFFAGRSLEQGDLKETKLASCMKSAKASKLPEVFFSDYEYLSEANRTSAFFCVKMFAEFAHLSEGISKGDFLGVVVGELDIKYLTSILSARDGMGSTGQTYLIGSDGLLRSDFYINQEKFNTLNSHKNQLRIENQNLHEIFNGKPDSMTVLTDPNGHEVLSAMTNIKFKGQNWAVVSEKEISEIYAPVSDLLKKVFLYSMIILVLVYFVVALSVNKLLSPIISASRVLGEVCHSLHNDSGSLTESASTLNNSSNEQSTALQATVQAVHEISSTIKNNSSNAKNTEDLAKASLITAENGKRVMGEMVQSMNEINKGNQDILRQVEESNKQINDILLMISEIGTKTKMINDIVFQTKLLSFNASVEAARAGENGKGFAVVAEEVGNLASSSGTSAREISELLNDSVSKVESIIRDTKEKVNSVSELGKLKVAAGQETANKCNLVFEEIVRSFDQVSALVTEISAASNEQNEGMGAINNAMARLNEGTAKNIQVASVSNEAALQLESRSKTLQDVVDNIQKVIHGR